MVVNRGGCLCQVVLVVACAVFQQGCEANAQMTRHATPFRQPSVTIKPIEATASDYNSPVAEKKALEPTTSEGARIAVPPLTMDAASSNILRQSMYADEETRSRIIEQTAAMHNEFLRQVCSELRQALQRRAVVVVESGGDVQVEVKLTNLSFESVGSPTIRVDVSAKEWKESAQGRSVNKVCSTLAKRLAEYLKSRE